MADEAVVPKSKRRGRILYALFILVFTIGCAEIGARIYLAKLGKATEKKFRFDYYRVYEHVPGFHEGDGTRDWIVINANGFRRSEDVAVKKPEGTYRIFLMGGSAAHGISSAEPYPVRHIYMEETIDAHLEQMLRSTHPGMRIEVINAAVTGYQVFQHTAYLQSELLDYDPDLVIFFDGANDHYTYNPDFRYMQDFRYQFWKERMQQPSLAGLWMHFADWMSEYSGLFRGYMAWTLNNDALQRSKATDFLGSASDPAEVIRMHRQVAPRQFLRNIATNLFLLQRQGVKAILCLQPELTLRDTTLLTAEEKSYLRVDRDIMLLYPEVIRELDSVAAPFAVPVIDMNTPFNDPRYRDQTLLIDYCHLSPLGGEVVARELLPVVERIMIGKEVAIDSATVVVPR